MSLQNDKDKSEKVTEREVLSAEDQLKVDGTSQQPDTPETGDPSTEEAVPDADANPVDAKSEDTADDSKEVKPVSAKKEKKRISDKRAKSLKFFSVGSIFMGLALVIVINLLFDSTLGKKLSWDLTSTKLRSIGEESIELVSALEKDVEIVGLFDYDNYQSNSSFVDFLSLLEDYGKHGGDRLTVRYVDPQVQPSIITELDPNRTLDIVGGDFVVKSGNKVRLIKRSSCYNYDQNTGAMTSNSIESNFSGAISSVISDVVNKAYFVTNHGESPSEQIKTLMKNRNFEIADLDMNASGDIPEDCDLLVLNNPQQDISADEETDLLQFLKEKGGKLILVTGFSANNRVHFDRMNNVMHLMNLHITDAQIAETDPNALLLSNFSFYASIANAYRGANSSRAMVFDARVIQEFNNPKEYIEVIPLLTTSESAYLLEGGDQSTAGSPATLNAAMVSVYRGGYQESQAVVFGTAYMADDGFIAQFSANNANPQLFVKTASKMVGDEAGFYIPAKTYPTTVLARAPSANTGMLLGILFLVILPVALLVVAIVVYNRRKKL